MNLLSLTASIAELSAKRYTPAGIPAIDLLLEHESTQIEAGSERKVVLRIKALALGSAADALEKAVLSQTAKFKGFLATPKNGKSNGKSSVLHITEFETL